MRGSEHVSVAVLTAGGALWLMSGQHLEVTGPAVAAVSAAAIGSLVPDIDHPQAWISNRIPAALMTLGAGSLLCSAFTRWWIARDPSQMFGPMFSSMLEMLRPYLGWAWLSLGLGVALLVTSVVVHGLVEHRGPTHSLTVGAALSLVALVPLAIIGHPTLALWFGWGYLTHLLTDLLTPMGCPALLWPSRAGTPRPALEPRRLLSDSRATYERTPIEPRQGVLETTESEATRPAPDASGP